MTEREIFDAALAIADPASRAAYLDAACGGDSARREHIAGLLEAHLKLGSFLELPPSAIVRESGQTIDQLPLEKPGTQIGQYKLLQQIGEGGFGVVFMAEQNEPVKRRVALKIIKPGMDSRQVIARFEAERQALAMMDHVNIARVFDGGTTEAGRPYFVMELVHGVAITKYCDDNRLTPRQRLELFLPVCHAIQHAHQKGIIHRDIKPTNVMVTLYDGQPVPKIIDFGVAKATEQKLTERTLFTQYGTLVGTLEYMSPEQAEMSALGADTRSDIYSLGVLLYELLTGGTPLSHQRLKEVAYDEVLRMIREDEPPRPSTRLSGSGDALAAISAQRQTEPAKLMKLVRGELDWIVMKCLEKDRNRRYETANSLAADVQRYLSDEAVQACPPSVSYRLWKFVRKHRVGVVTTVSVLVLSLVGTAVSTWQAMRAATAERSALLDRDEKERALQAESKQRRLAVERHREASWNLYVARLGSMNQAWESGNVTRLRRLLKGSLPGEGEPDFRGWEWHLLQELARRTLTDLVGSDDYTGFATWCPASGRIAAATRGGAIDIWERDAARVVRTLQPGSGPIGHLAWSPDGERLACGAGGKLSVWSVSSGKLLHVLPGDLDMYSAMAWSPDRMRLASAGPGGDIRIWDAEKGTELRTLNAEATDDYVTDLAWHPDGVRLASAHRWGRTNVWDCNRGVGLFSRVKFGPPIYAVAWSPDGLKLATGRDPDIDVWSDRGDALATLRGHTFTVRRLAWSPDGRHLLSGADDRTARVWDVEKGSEVLALPCDERVCSVAWRGDGGQLLVGSFNDKPRHLPGEYASVAGVFLAGGLATNERADVLTKTQAHDAAWSPNGEWIATVTEAKKVEILSAKDGRRIHEWEVPGAVALAAVSWSPDSRRVVVADGTVGLVVWSVVTGERIAETAPGRDRGNVGVAWSPDGKWVALSNTHTGAVEVWDASSWKQVTTLAGPVGCGSVAWSPASLFLAAGTNGKKATIHVWAADSWREVYRVPAPNGIKSLAFSPDGRWLTAACNVDLVFYRAGDGERAHIARGGHSVIAKVQWSCDGRRIAAACRDGSLRIWDGATAAELLQLRCGTTRLTAAMWSPDNRQLACTSQDGVLRVWSAPSHLDSQRRLDFLETGRLAPPREQ